MQTHCPTEDTRERKMKRGKNGRMRRMMKDVTQAKLPHTRDPEFATPESQEKKIRTRTEKKRTQREAS